VSFTDCRSCEYRVDSSDNSTALLLITLVTTILQTASSDIEKTVLYRFLAEASVDMPEVVSMA
jgi:neurofibromin 1